MTLRFKDEFLGECFYKVYFKPALLTRAINYSLVVVQPPCKQCKCRIWSTKDIIHGQHSQQVLGFMAWPELSLYTVTQVISHSKRCE